MNYTLSKYDVCIFHVTYNYYKQSVQHSLGHYKICDSNES